MKKYIPLVIFIILLASLSFWGYKVFHERYENIPTVENKEITNNSQPEDQSAEQPQIQSSDTKSDEIPSDDEETPPADAVPEKNNYLDVSPADCNNKCKDFTASSELKYCQQYCGITANNKVEKKEGCNALKDLERDYCFKDYALSKQDISICEKIDDTGIQKACQSKLGQELINIREQQ